MGRHDHESVPETEGQPPRARPTRLRLVVLSGDDRGRELLIEQGTYHVGKDPRCALVLSDAAVSRRHLELEVGAEGVIARDASKNGSFVDGARFREVTLDAGMVLRLGATELRVVLPTAPQPRLPSQATSFGRLLGASLAMRELYATLERAAPTTASVLIEGETGTGKELCAESIHANSARASGPFVVVDLASISPTLIDSELLGHRRGAFTGADRDRDGAFALADGGTVFLDEIGELPLDVQTRLLRVLAERTVRPVGATTARKVDVRVIAATNRNLSEACKAGRFREDLYHRLAVVEVTMPPLRKRLDDLPRIVEHQLRARLGRAITLDPAALQVLMAYHWPGNVRELGNVVERSLPRLRDGDRLTAAMLGLDAAVGVEAPAAGDFFAMKDHLIDTWEKRYLTDLLARAEQSVSRAALLSGINRPYLHRLLKKHGMGGSKDA
jgi:DNA-binding NtrC family response regulator